LAAFQTLLEDGEEWGLKISYAIQPKPEGLAQALIIGEKFLGGDACCLILGDNLFYGDGIGAMAQNAARICEGEEKAVIFGYQVADPSRYGVVELDTAQNILSLEEKPAKPKSAFAITGLYFFPPHCAKVAKAIKPSARGELEIIDAIKAYAKEGRAKVELLGRGFAWLDTGTSDSLLEAGDFVRAIEKRQGLKIACLEEIAYLMGYISREKLAAIAEKYAQSSYGDYLRNIARSER
jgi:glucose-1-phosphate thymidylyltransferase